MRDEAPSGFERRNIGEADDRLVQLEVFTAEDDVVPRTHGLDKSLQNGPHALWGDRMRLRGPPALGGTACA